MPGQFFNFGRYFSKKSTPADPSASGGDQSVSQTVTTTTSSSVSGMQSYSGIGPPPQPSATNSVVTTQVNKIIDDLGKTDKKEADNKDTNKQDKPLDKKSAAPPPTSPNFKQSPPGPAGGVMDNNKRAGMDVLTRLTQRANQALMGAVAKAKELKIQLVDTEHVLWALLQDSSVFALVSELKVAPKEIQDELTKSFKMGNFNGGPQFSPRVKRVLELSLSTARSLGYEFISPEHILLALVQEAEGQAAQIMKKYHLGEKELGQKVTGKKETDKDKDEEKKGASVLELYTEDLTAKAKLGTLDPVVGRSWEIERAIHILSRRTKNNPVLIGDAGVGKTAIVEGLAERIARGDVPETLLNKRILSLDLMSLIAGAKARGEFEERLKNLLKEVKAGSGAIILFIDEIHNMVGAGSGGEGTMDASNILKPSLARGELQAIGTTTVTEYRKYIEKDPALERRFQPVLVPEPTVEQAIEMLRALRDKYEAFHRVKIPDETIESAVRLSQRYIGDRFLPDKAVDLIDEASAAVRLPAISLPEEIKSAQDKMLRLETERKDAEKTGDSVRQATIEKEADELKGKIANLNQEYQLSKSTTTNIVKPEIIAETVSRWTNIPISRLTESESSKLLSMEDLIHKRIIDQEQAVVSIAEAVRRGRAGLKSNKRPIGSFVFMGPTGVGKTELAKALAEILFGSEEMMVRLDMSEYMEKHEVAKLIGAPPGYVGYEEGGQLTEAVRRRPYSVVLLDEIEKAHPDVFNILIQILDDGRLTDNKGHTISFKNTIVICTSNIGTGLIQGELLGGVKLRAPSAKPFKTYTVSPTGREIITLADRFWEKSKEDKVWKTAPLSDYFAGSTVNGDKGEFPSESFDTHLIAADGSESISFGDKSWSRTSTVSKEWVEKSILEQIKGQTVVNAMPDKPEEQLPTAHLDTHALSPSNLEVITLDGRFWRRENMQTNDWMSGTLEEYLTGGIVVKKETKNELSDTKKKTSKKTNAQDELEIAKSVIHDEKLQLPLKKWDMHVFTPLGEEIVIAGNRYWKRASVEKKEWVTDLVLNIFPIVKTNDDKYPLPLGAAVEKTSEEEADEMENFKKLAERLLEELRKFFRPELLNRFDEIVVFRPLTEEHMLAIVELQFKILAKLLEEQSIGVVTTDEAKKEIARLGYDPMYGARPLRRTIQRYIENQISSLLIRGDLAAGDTLNIDFDGNDFIFAVKKLAKPSVKDETGGVTKSFKCNYCGKEFKTEIVSKATTICPFCAGASLSELKETPLQTANKTGVKASEEEKVLQTNATSAGQTKDNAPPDLKANSGVSQDAGENKQLPPAVNGPNQTPTSDLKQYFGEDNPVSTEEKVNNTGGSSLEGLTQNTDNSASSQTPASAPVI